MKKILFFETCEFTGATRVTRTLAEQAKKCFDVVYAKIGDNVWYDIHRAISKEAPDILFSSFIHINPQVIEIAKSLSLYVVVRNDYNLSDVADDIRLRIYNSYNLADLIIAQTEQMRQDLLDFLDVDPSSICVMENPLDTKDMLHKANAPNPFPNNGYFHFVWVGRQDPLKDLKTLHDAFEIIHQKYPKTDLTIISGVSNPYPWIKYADCLLISSRSEASPNVLREALFFNTSVISTDCSPTVRQLLQNHRIVPIGDPVSFAGAMECLLQEKNFL